MAERGKVHAGGGRGAQQKGEHPHVSQGHRHGEVERGKGRWVGIRARHGHMVACPCRALVGGHPGVRVTVTVTATVTTHLVVTGLQVVLNGGA
eukprot:1188800-Prorocentrum_minimum.AAC.5